MERGRWPGVLVGSVAGGRGQVYRWAVTSNLLAFVFFSDKRDAEQRSRVARVQEPGLRLVRSWFRPSCYRR